jgi:DNA helicase II / ATP-dependent DNA helicase PcrA
VPPTAPIDADALLADLTPEQRLAVTTTDGPLLVLAAAGSGKTRVLTRRVAYLIATGTPPGAIVAITFTNKAAGEMKHRVGQLMGREIREFGRLADHYPAICTFHSLCIRILRHYSALLGLRTLTIYDTSDQTRLVKDVLKTLDISATNFPPGSMLSAISSAKNQLLGPQQYAASAKDFYQRRVAAVYAKYQNELEQAGAFDFDDLLLRTVRAFREHPAMLAELQQRFQYILIDEYQDTNHAQYILAQCLALSHRNLCVVGDPDQSIYAWRGADIANILSFKKDYPDAAEVKLEVNYRSTPTILAAADALIKRNTRRLDKRLLTPNPDGGKIRLHLADDEHAEAYAVVNDFKALHAQGLPWNAMAVFYRMNSLSRVIEEALRRANIPYVMARGVEFYNRKEIKDVLAYLKAVANLADEISLDRMINTPPRGIGDTTVEKMRAQAIARGLRLWDIMLDTSLVPGLSTRARNAVALLVKNIQSWRDAAALDSPSPPEPQPPTTSQPSDSEPDLGMFADLPLPPPPPLPPPSLRHADAPSLVPLTDLITRIVQQSGLEELYKRESRSAADDGNDPLGNINQLITSAAEFIQANPDGTLEDFLTQVALVSDTDGLRQTPEGAVTMMTLHAAKGLEFPAVAIIGMEEGILPHQRARGDLEQTEEERRLFFVGMTRAQRHLILSKAQSRTVRGLRERTITSPFLIELPSDRVETLDSPSFPTSQTPPSASALKYKPGTQIKHPVFGLGTIREVESAAQGTRCVVEFRIGRKTIFLEYAKVEVVA